MLDVIDKAEISDLRPSSEASRQIWKLQAAARELPAIEIETKHFFAPGMYARAGRLSKGSVIVGKVHRTTHFFIVTSGRVAVSDKTGTVELEAGAVVVSAPGTKRAIVALTDASCLNVHRTDLTDLDAIEAELVEPDPTALFDARNLLIGGA